MHPREEPAEMKISHLEAELADARELLKKRRRRIKRMEVELREARLPAQETVEAFHRLYYGLGAEGGTFKNTYWMGVLTQKLPLDLWIYQEILHETRPDLIVETGTYEGGSALYLASICDLLGRGRVMTIDITERGFSGNPRSEHPRIHYVLGSSTDEAVLDEVRKEAQGAEGVMVILDSDHSEKHVFRELEAYSPLVSPGHYLVVEDTNVNGNPVLPSFGPGPMEAVERFLSGTDAFEPDADREKFLLTFNPRGYLKRVQ
jgi:cephalosporin hydroxylase